MCKGKQIAGGVNLMVTVLLTVNCGGGAGGGGPYQMLLRKSIHKKAKGVTH